MMKKLSRPFMFFVISLVFCSLAFPQAQTGSIKGTVVDSEGNPLSGATVTVSSEVLMGTQTYISTQEGAYRFPALPPGVYSATVEMPGFKKTSRGEIGVRVGVAVNIDFVMEMGALAEEVTVVAPAPALDVKQSKLAVSMTKTMLENIPLARDLTDIVYAAPGSVLTGGRYVSMRGSSVRGNAYAFDGANMFDPANGSVMNTLNVDIMDEVELITAGFPAEVGTAEGGYINIVTRSGGNKFSGSGLVYYTDKNMLRSLWTDEQAKTFGVPQPLADKNWFDASLSVGGPIITDKLWFFSNFRYDKRVISSPFIPFTDILGKRHEAVDYSQKETYAFIKLSSQLTPKIKLFGMFNFLKQSSPGVPGVGIWTGDPPSPYEPYEASRIMNRWERTVNTVLNYVLDQNTFFDIKFSYVDVYYNILLQKGTEDLPVIRDYGTPYSNITNARYNEAYTRQKYLGGLTFTKFLDSFLKGNHEIKAGADWELGILKWDNFRKDNMILYYNKGPYYYNAADRLGRVSFTFFPPEEKGLLFPGKVQRLGAFIQDNVTFFKKLTLNLGIRFDRFSGWTPAWEKAASGNPLSIWVGENVLVPYAIKNFSATFPNGFNPFTVQSYKEWKDILIWNTFSPRIGLSYDVFGNGKTALKVSFSSYSSYMRIETFAASHPGCPGFGTFNFLWQDSNANGQPDTSDQFTFEPADLRRYDLEYAKNSIDPKTKAPITQEYTVGIWQELFKEFSLGFNFVFKDMKNIVETQLYDTDRGEAWYYPGQPAAQRNWIPFTTIVPGSGVYPDQSITVYARSNAAPIPYWRFSNVPELKRKYWGWELAFNKRLSHGWQLSGSIDYSKSYGNLGSTIGPTWGYSAAADDINYFVNGYGRLDVDIPLAIKVMGTVQLPWGINFSGYYRHLSGFPWTRTVSIRVPQSWAVEHNAYWTAGTYATVNIEPLGSRRDRASDILDIRLEKELKIRDIGTLGAYIDVFNLLGWSSVNIGRNDLFRYTPSAENTLEPKNITADPSYKKISSILGQRSFKLSIRFRF